MPLTRIVANGILHLCCYDNAATKVEIKFSATSVTLCASGCVRLLYRHIQIRRDSLDVACSNSTANISHLGETKATAA